MACVGVLGYGVVCRDSVSDNLQVDAANRIYSCASLGEKMMTTPLFYKPAPGKPFKLAESVDYNEVVLMPPGRGMSVFAHQAAAKEKMVAGIRQASNAICETIAQSMRTSCKWDAGHLATQKKPEPYYRQFEKNKF